VNFAAGAFGPLKGVFAALPPFPGKLKLIDAMAALSCHLGISEGESSPWPGTHFYADLHDRIQRQMWCGSYEPHLTRCLMVLLRPGNTFLDVGAHIGYVSFHAAWAVGPRGRVFSFEPNADLFPRLQKNLSCYPQALATPAAVWDTETELVYETSSISSESGWGTLTGVRNLGTGRHISVQSITLDGFCKRNALSSIRAIKIDAEGSEAAILRGGQAVFQELRPILLMEFNSQLLRQAQTSSEQLRATLLERGYVLYILQDLRVESLKSLANIEFADCLCIPNELSAAVLSELKSNGFSLG
jgi:FkbM family methyltransferase